MTRHYPAMLYIGLAAPTDVPPTVRVQWVGEPLEDRPIAQIFPTTITQAELDEGRRAGRAIAEDAKARFRAQLARLEGGP